VAASVFYQSSDELATLANTFSVVGTATDPTAATLTVTSPANASTVYSWPTGSPALTRTGTGAFTQDVTCNEAGDWTYLWEGTGTASDAQAGSWTVYETTLGKLYATVDALKSRLRLTDTSQDYEVHTACFAASRSVELVCERVFFRTAADTIRTFVPQYRSWVKLGPFNDLLTLASLKTDASGDGTFETTWTSSDYQLHPINPAAAPETRPYTKIKAVGSLMFPLQYCGLLTRDDRVQVTGVWGWPAIPWAVKKAAQMLAEELMKDAPFGVSSSPDYGVVRVRENPRIMKLLAPYVHPDAALKVG
jgi:hypothetical protein